MSTVLIGADLCPIERNRALFVSGDAKALFNDILPDLENADLSIANIECPLIDRPSPILKTGPTFGEPPECINGMRAGGLSVLNLCNNHIMDHGEAGLRSTMRACDEAGIATVGAGPDLAAARRILVRETPDARIGILAMAEHEFSIAGRASWGANPLDMVDFVRNVRERKDELDFLVVLLHGGHEFCPYPSPRIRDTCRFMVEMGADFVAVQHAHCLGGYEAYGGGHIVYGQGAFVMDEAIYRDLGSFHEGYLVRLEVERGRQAEIELLPFRQSEDECGARKMSTEDAEKLLGLLADKSEAIQDTSFLEDRWGEFCELERIACLSAVMGHGRILRRLNQALGGRLFNWIYGRSACLSLQNVIRCETHREILETLLGRECGKRT